MIKILMALLLLPSLPAGAQEATRHSATATSSITTEVLPGSGLVIHQRTVGFHAYNAIPDDLSKGPDFPLRLATITAIVDGVVDDQNKTIEVTIDDISADGSRRLAAFSDPGSEGEEVGGLFFISTEPGCCALPARHHVRNIETGQALFGSSGPGEAGMAIWMNVPNRHPTVERWVAFEGAAGTDALEKDPAILGHLRYGSRTEVLSDLVFRMDVPRQPEEFYLDLPSCGALSWIEPGTRPVRGSGHSLRHGKCSEGGGYFSQGLFSLEHSTAPLGGFEVEMSLLGKVYATIPVKNDRLDITAARLAPGVALAPSR